MFTLIPEKSRFYRVKRGQNAREVSISLGQPVLEDLSGGMIIPVNDGYIIHEAGEGETFYSLSQKFGVSEDAVKKANGGVIYPSCKLFIPSR